MRRTGPALALLSALALLAAACSSDGGSDGAGAAGKTTTTAPAADEPFRGNECDQGASLDEVVAERVPDSESDWVMTSFDDTEIRLHWFPLPAATGEEPAPTVLMGPGWSLPGDVNTDPAGLALFSPASIPSLWEAGYNVLTWDPRGFGKSEGIATVNDPDFEGRDVQAMLDFVAEQPMALVDGPGDPRVGMVGYSYGGGIQLTTAAIDCRVEALVPGIAWHSLETSLYKAETVKKGWADVLTSTIDPDRVDPHIISAKEAGDAGEELSEEDRQWFLDRGPGELVGEIEVPTLFVGGTVDTLFTLDEDITNFLVLQGNDVPVAMIWFCGGHGTCLTDAGEPDRVTLATNAWLDRFVKGDESVALPPALDLIDQHGEEVTFDEWPVAEGEPITASGSGTLELAAGGGAGGDAEVLDLPADDPLAGIVANITPTKAERSVDVVVTNEGEETLALGAPMLSLTYTVSGGDPDGQTRVFAQLVDDESGTVVGNQITPIALAADGDEHTVEVPLEVIAHRLAAGQTLTLQLVATTTAYATPTLQGTVELSDIDLSIPTAALPGGSASGSDA